MRSTIISLKKTLWLSITSQYVVLAKISENLLLITWILTLSPNFHRHPSSNYLGLLYNDPSDFVIFGSTYWIQPALACLVHVACLDLFNGYETPHFQPELHFREHAEFAGGQVRWVGRLGNSGHSFCQEFPHNERGVCRRMFMVSVLPHLWPFAPHIFPQSSQNLAVKCLIDSLTRWNKLLITVPRMPKKKWSALTWCCCEICGHLWNA